MDFQPETYFTPHLYPEIPQNTQRLTQEIHEKTEELIKQITYLAGSIICKDIPLPPPYAPHVTTERQPMEKQRNSYAPYIDLSTKSFSMLNSRAEEHRPYSSEEHYQEKKQEHNKCIRLIVGIFAIAGAFFTAYKIGQAVGEGEEVQETFFTFKELKRHWIEHQDRYNSNEHIAYRELVNRIVNKAEGILQRRETNRVHKMTLLVLCLAACGTSFTGSILGSSVLMAAGLGMGVLGSGLTLYKLGYAYFSTCDQRDARFIDKDVRELRSIANIS